MRTSRLLVAFAFGACLSGPAPSPVTLGHQAYVWQRTWTEDVREGVRAALPALTVLRVLALELDRRGREVVPGVDATALARAGRPVVAVARVEGARLPAELSLARLDDIVRAWREAGVPVIGLEIDHDCATAALGDYARWLERLRRERPGERWSVTALPTWASQPGELVRLAATVDEIVVQVHAIRAPEIFDAAQARRWLERFALAAPGVSLRVALPTYRAFVAGEARRPDPVAVASLLRSLEQDPIPGLAGVVWFRLPSPGDESAWPAATLRAVIRGEPLGAAVAVSSRQRAAQLYDLVLENRGSLASPLPTLRLGGRVNAADLTHGYRPDPEDPRRWLPPPGELRAGARAVVGWARGEELDVVAE
jgi:hypothetical protein